MASDLGKPESALGGSAWAPVWARVRQVASVVVPTTLLTSLFFYFGYVYTARLYANFGISATGMEFGTTDYIIRSLNVLVEPLPFVAFVALAFLLASLLVTLVAKRFTAPGTGAGAGGMSSQAKGTNLAIGLWVVLVGLGLLVAFVAPRPDTYPGPVFGRAGWTFVALLTVLYGLHFAFVRGRTDGTSGVASSIVRSNPTAAVLAVILGVLVLAHSAFEVTRLYAYVRADRQALDNERSCTSFALAQVFSTVDLGLDHLDVDHALKDRGDNGFNHQYGEFRLFLHDNGRYLLWPVDRSPRDGLLMLTQNDSLRVESRPQLLTPEQRSAASCPPAQAQAPRRQSP